MVQYTLVPTLLIALINICVFIYVLRLGDQSKSGFFLLINALALIIWSGGRTLYEFFGETTNFILMLPHVAALLIPANFLYYAISRPKPIRPKADSTTVLFIIFLPALFLAAIEDYGVVHGLLFDYRLSVDDLAFGRRTSRAAVLFSAFCFSLSLAIFSIRYNTSMGPEKTLSKHLVAVVAGPFFFAGFFWAASQHGGGINVIPSPSLILVIMAQAGLVVVLRQEEHLSKRLLARTAYYLTAILVAVLLVFLLIEFYTFHGGSVVLDRTIIWLMMLASLLLLLLARLRPVESILDRIVFERAAEYRKLMRETQLELREARERLRRAERMSVVGELSARVAHEIKNPLGPIKGYTQMMRDKLLESPDFEHRSKFLDYLDVISEETENIDRRVAQFLDSARMEEIKLVEVEINKLVQRCARLMEMEASAHAELTLGEPVQIIIRCEEGLGNIQADHSRLEEVIFNLGRNAMEALRDKGTGSVSLTTRGGVGPDGVDGVEIIIEDDGPGFPSDHAEIFFEPFISNKKGGTGLGLSIVKSYVEAHSGVVTIGNREDRGGARAVVWLPREGAANPGALLPEGGGQAKVEPTPGRQILEKT